MVRKKHLFAFVIVALVLPYKSLSQSKPDYRVTWNEPGGNYKGSMPIGNGDIGLNLWVEDNGDIVFLIGKTDAWTENDQLVKLGRVRVSLSPSPFAKDGFLKQELIPGKGEIDIISKSGPKLVAWVDANNPVIHLEMEGQQAVQVKVSAEIWRTQARVTKQKGAELGGIGVFRELSGIPSGEVIVDPDTVLSAQNNQLCWLHHNSRSTYPIVFENQHLESLLSKYPDPLLNRSFGVLMKAEGLIAENNATLQSPEPKKNFRLDIYALTQQSSIPVWHQKIVSLVAKTDAIAIEKARRAHDVWWKNFWDRSWMNVSGDKDAENVTQGYAMQRFMYSASGRGAMPLKYNGSIFTVGQEPSAETPYDPAKGRLDADYRAWGGNYWFQNQRLVYWPMIAAGDKDMLMPFINMYVNAMPLAIDRTRMMYGHNGAAFPETINFWGLPNNNDFGWGNKSMIIANTWIKNHVNGGIELTAMMLDQYETDHDQKFLRDKLLPVATAITTYFDEHWKRVKDKIDMDPSQALETRQVATNPTPDIAGLMCILPRLNALPTALVEPETKKMWRRILTDLPPLPLGRTDSAGKIPQLPEDMSSKGLWVIWPAERFQKPRNVENAELYAVFPYHIYGVDRPGLQIALNTYEARIFKSSTCWGQDGVEAALLGLTDKAKEEVVANFTTYGQEKFKWFWAKGHDWEPDMDNGGAGQINLQAMLLQTNGNKILLFPAWPKDWNVDFKLHVPGNTVIQGNYKNGKLEYLKVIPESRKKDIINMLYNRL